MLNSSRRSPLHYGRLGSLEERLNVSSAPQRGASLHLRRRAGLGVGLKIMIMNKQSFFLVAAVVLLSACGAKEETKFLNANPEAVVITSDGKATNGMVCTAGDQYVYLDHVLYRVSGNSMVVRGTETGVTPNIKIVPYIVFKGTEYKVTKIGDSAFRSNKVMNSIELPKTLEEIESNAFRMCKTLRTISLPDATKTIGEWAFGSCEALTSVIFGHKLENIGEAAFWNTPINYISLPSTVKTIGAQAFGSCDNLRTMRVAMMTPPDNSGLGSNSSNIILYVPFGTKDAYNANYYWRCKEIIEE